MVFLASLKILIKIYKKDTRRHSTKNECSRATADCRMLVFDGFVSSVKNLSRSLDRLQTATYCMASSLSRTNSHKTKKFSATCPIPPGSLYTLLFCTFLFRNVTFHKTVNIKMPKAQIALNDANALPAFLSSVMQ